MSSVSGSGGSDRTLNKVALCSAVFAGFAYVGYSYAKTAFCRKLPRKLENEGNAGTEVSRVVFRRLSQTTQTDVLLGNLDTSDSYGKVILRPKSVQERIKELNLRARQFTDTFVAIQSGNDCVSQALSRNATLHGPSSLQCSPWSSPRLMSPIDVQHFISHSTENLSELPCEKPAKIKWNRRSLRQRRSEDKDALERRKRLEYEAQKLCENSYDELAIRLESLGDRGRVLTPFEAKSLVALLYSDDKALIKRTLVTIANCAAFSVNLDFFREVGCIFKLSELMKDPDVRLTAVQTLGNIVLSEENIKHAKDCLLLLMEFARTDDPALQLASLVVLTNIATVTEWHDEYCNLLNGYIENGNEHVKLQSLRLLINLSCNKDMIPSLLAAEGPKRLSATLNRDMDDGILLRTLTLLGTLALAVVKEGINPTIDLPPEDKAASPDTMHGASSSSIPSSSQYARMLGIGVRDVLASNALEISQKHPNDEIRRQAARLHCALKD